jgi:hypothetical protein
LYFGIDPGGTGARSEVRALLAVGKPFEEKFQQSRQALLEKPSPDANHGEFEFRGHTAPRSRRGQRDASTKPVKSSISSQSISSLSMGPDAAEPLPGRLS